MKSEYFLFPGFLRIIFQVQRREFMYKTWLSFTFSLAILLALAACGTAEATQPPGGNVPGISLSITGSACPGVEIRANEQITWTNADTVDHPIRVEFEDGETFIDLGVLQPGDSASVTFPEAGSYSLYLHDR
jgi:hypothetical protein